MNNRYESIVAIYKLIVMWAGSVINALFGSTDGMFLTLIAFMVEKQREWQRGTPVFWFHNPGHNEDGKEIKHLGNRALQDKKGKIAVILQKVAVC